MAVKNLLIRGGADFSGIQKEMAKTQGALSKFQSNVSKIMKGIGLTLSTLGIGKIVKDATNTAIGVESAVNQINRTMGKSASGFIRWANEQSGAYGIAKADALKYGAVYSNLVSGFSKDTAETTKNTEDLLKASAVVASGTGRTMEDTMERIRSGLLGNTEAIEDLGINVNVAMLESTRAFQQFANGKSWDQLSFQTQQQIRLMAILEQTNIKYGDSLANTTATQMQMFKAELKNIQLSLGQAFMPILNTVLPILTAFASRLAYIIGIVAQFTQALFGKSGNSQAQAQAKAVGSQSKAVSGLGNATENAGKKAKKAGKEAKGALVSFDEINQFDLDKGSSSSEDSGSSGAGVGAIGTEPLPMDFSTNAPEISEKVTAMAEDVKQKVREIGEAIFAHKEIIISVLGGIFAAIATFKTLTFLSTVPTLLTTIGGAFAGLLTPIAIASAAIGALVAVFLYLYQTNEQFRTEINTIWSDIGNTFNSFWSDTLKPIGSYIINDFIKPIAEGFKNNIVPVLAEMFIGASKIFHDLVKLIQSTIDNMWSIIKPALELIKTIITDTLEIIKNLWDKYGQTLIKNLRKFIEGVQETFQLLWDKVLKPIIQPFLEMLDWLWTKHLKALVQQIGDFIMKCVNGALELYNGFIKPIIDWMIVEFGPTISNTVAFISDVFGTMLAFISDIIKGIVKILGGLIDFIVGVFTGNWKKCWEGIKDIFKGVFDSLFGIVKAPINLIIDALNYVIRGLNSLSIDIPDWVAELTGVSGTWGINIPTIPKLARGGIVDGATTFIAGEAGKEMVVPLENTSFVDKLAGALGTAVMSAMQFNNQGNNNNGGDIVLQVDGTTFARLMNPYGNKESSRVGSPMIVTT